MFNIQFIFFDLPTYWQIFFQDPATSIMENIIDLHHDILFFLILIIIFVLFMLIQILKYFKTTNFAFIKNIKNNNILFIESNFLNIFWKKTYTNIRILFESYDYNFIFLKKEFTTDELTKPNFNLTHNTTIEIIWTFIPTFILLIIALPSYVLIYNMDELHDPEITLKIIGKQWYWSYQYADTFLSFKDFDNQNYNFDSYIKTENDLNEPEFRLLHTNTIIQLPINTTIRLLVTAFDVIHSWALPSGGIKMDATPGRLCMLTSNFHRLSTFFGQCSELCGIKHSFMPIMVEILPIDKYVELSTKTF